MKGNRALVKAVKEVANANRAFAIAWVIGFLIVTGLVIAALVIIIQTKGDTHKLTDLDQSAKGTDYNPCTKDVSLDNVIAEYRIKNGKNCSDWVCLAPPGNATCQYSTVFNEEVCVGLCAGACTGSTTSGCPTLNFTSTAPSATLACNADTCTWNLPFPTAYLTEPGYCDPADLYLQDLCLSYLDTDAVNVYIDQHCLVARPICNNTPGAPGTHLSSCDIFFGCTRYGSA